jgi:hypothetical protein
MTGCSPRNVTVATWELAFVAPCEGLPIGREYRFVATPQRYSGVTLRDSSQTPFSSPWYSITTEANGIVGRESTQWTGPLQLQRQLPLPPRGRQPHTWALDLLGLVFIKRTRCEWIVPCLRPPFVDGPTCHTFDGVGALDPSGDLAHLPAVN